MTTFQIVSDLHIEYKNNNIPEPLSLLTPSADILILAGDIGSLYKFNQLKEFLKKLSKYFLFIIYVPGNHEYYKIENINPIEMEKLSQKFLLLEIEINNLIILNKNYIKINDICIIGCTLWSKSQLKIPNFIKIFGINNKIYNDMFENNLSYINKMIKICKYKNLKLIVITHYCPTYQVLPEKKKRNKYVSFYTSNLDNLLDKSKIHTWICGHIHSNFDIITEGGTRIIGNQKGKPNDFITNYSKTFTITI